MDRVRQFLDDVRRGNHVQGNLLGLFNVLIGRHLSRPDGSPISQGLPWRVLAGHLKRARWDREDVRSLGLDPEALPPRDRERFWFSAIAQVQVDSPSATAAGDRMAEILRALGYQVGTSPGSARPPSS